MMQFFLGRPWINSSVMLVNSQQFASCQLGFERLSCLVDIFVSCSLSAWHACKLAGCS